MNFDWGQDMVAAMLQVESAINQVCPACRRGRLRVRRMDPTVFPVLAYSLTSDTHSLVELRDLALYQIRPVLSTVAGVARMDVQGGAQAEYQVVVDPARLASYGLTLDDVARPSPRPTSSPPWAGWRTTTSSTWSSPTPGFTT